MIKTVRGKINFICSGALLSSTLAITTAHCIENADQVWITNAPKLETTTPMIQSADYKTHPSYTGNNFKGYDLGVVHLKKGIKLGKYFKPEPLSIEALKKLTLKREGYGLRQNKNQRQVFSEPNEKVEFAEHYLQTYDENGLLGDSGGPVYFVRKNNLILVGLHTGRKQGADGKLENYSNTLVMTDELAKWIQLFR